MPTEVGAFSLCGFPVGSTHLSPGRVRGKQRKVFSPCSSKVKRGPLGENKKHLILQVATEVFSEKGFKWYFAVQNAGF
ncbi:MAG: hypothetical protein OEW45_07255 [Deltaproteobacteria bacterium]|nr:hypothetical protein [Deltaproteobacteria bacterium]